MDKLFPVLLLLLAAPGLHLQSLAQSADGNRILALENAWNQAIQQKDAAALKILLAPELVYVDYDGALMDKITYLTSVQSPSLHPTRIVNESMSARLYGTVAVVSDVCRETGTRNGKPYAVLIRFTDTWIRRGESWMCVASHSTLIPR
jgi:ketosteroid isomerase-like protein